LRLKHAMVLYESSFQGEVQHVRHLEGWDSPPDSGDAKPRRLLHLKILTHISFASYFLHGLDSLKPPRTLLSTKAPLIGWPVAPL